MGYRNSLVEFLSVGHEIQVSDLETPFFSRVAGGVRHGKCSTIGSHGHRMDCGKDVEAEPRSIGDGPPFFQWEFQDPKMEVPTIYKAYVRPM